MLYSKEVENFINPYYSNKDTMHNMEHIQRVINLSLQMCNRYENQVNKELIFFGAYFHGLIYEDEIRSKIKDFLKQLEFSSKKVTKIVEISFESQKDETPHSLEGKILHDAHLLEGGETFLIVKSLITGSLRGQSIVETIEYIESNILHKHQCVLPENQEAYKQKEAFAIDFINRLKPHI